MGKDQDALITLSAAPASDSWGFVGVIRVGKYEAYRTIRAYRSPSEALETAQRLLGGVLGTLMAGQEWRTAEGDFGHPPLRTELGFGLRSHRVAVSDADQGDRVPRPSAPDPPH